MNLNGKHSIELNIVGDGREFLNYWDWAHGRDVCCQIRDGRLFKSNWGENGDELPETEITFAEFLDMVRQSISAIPI